MSTGHLLLTAPGVELEAVEQSSRFVLTAAVVERPGGDIIGPFVILPVGGPEVLRALAHRLLEVASVVDGEEPFPGYFHDIGVIEGQR